MIAIFGIVAIIAFASFAAGSIAGFFVWHAVHRPARHACPDAAACSALWAKPTTRVSVDETASAFGSASKNLISSIFFNAFRIRKQYWDKDKVRMEKWTAALNSLKIMPNWALG